MLLLLLLAAPTTECPVRASSSPIALFFLLSLPQPRSPHLASPLTLLARLVQLLNLPQHLVELSVSTSEQTVQLLYRRVRVSGRGHEIAHPRIVYTSQSTLFLSSSPTFTPPLLAAASSRLACLPACLTACLRCATRLLPREHICPEKHNRPDQTRWHNSWLARLLARRSHTRDHKQYSVCLAPAVLVEVNPRTTLTQATMGNDAGPKLESAAMSTANMSNSPPSTDPDVTAPQGDDTGMPNTHPHAAFPCCLVQYNAMLLPCLLGPTSSTNPTQTKPCTVG